MCRKKKIKCDGKMPACSHCINYKTECIFTQVEKKRHPPKGYCSLRHGVLSAALTYEKRKIHRGIGKSSWSNGVSLEVVWVTGRRGR